MSMVAKILSGTALLICLYLVLSNASGTTSMLNSIGSIYTNSVKTLQGR